MFINLLGSAADNIGGGGGICDGLKIFTSTGSITLPDNAERVYLLACAAGNNGGSPGAGGAAGQWVEGIYPVSSSHTIGVTSIGTGNTVITGLSSGTLTLVKGGATSKYPGGELFAYIGAKSYNGLPGGINLTANPGPSGGAGGSGGITFCSNGWDGGSGGTYIGYSGATGYHPVPARSVIVDGIGTGNNGGDGSNYNNAVGGNGGDAWAYGAGGGGGGNAGTYPARQGTGGTGGPGIVILMW